VNDNHSNCLLTIIRWETEEWTIRLSSDIKRVHKPSKTPLRILDLCTGSGCIALALAHRLPPNSAQILAADKSLDAILLARRNKHFNKTRLRNQVRFFQANVMRESFITRVQQLCRLMSGDPVDTGHVDIIVSNPPYVDRDVYTTLDPDVRLWEDRCALVVDSGDCDLFYHKIGQLANAILRPSWIPHAGIPNLNMEIGDDRQGQRVKRWMQQNLKVDVVKDMSAKGRLITITSVI